MKRLKMLSFREELKSANLLIPTDFFSQIVRKMGLLRELQVLEIVERRRARRILVRRNEDVPSLEIGETSATFPKRNISTPFDLLKVKT
jgi:hypothetical protein